MTVQPIPGGITAARGFRAAAAALFTTNQVQAAPVTVSREHLLASDGRVSAVLVNSGCANACTGAGGLIVARASAETLAARIGCPAIEVLVASTGVIGVALSLDRVRTGIAEAHAALSANGHPAALAIMTTDLRPKEYAVRVETPRGAFHVGGIAKGAGMIEPLMATMLGFVTTDADVTPALLHRLLQSVVDRTFNAITVDGECSTNDTVLAMASGASGVTIGNGDGDAALIAGLEAVCRELALMIVRGGEGATKLVAVRVTGAASAAAAKQAARTVANSLLVKTAVHGGDPNWGRLVAATGRSGVPFDLAHARVRIGPAVLFRDGQPFDGEAPRAAEYLRGMDIDIDIDLGTGGPHEATVWTCDLSAEYVRINGEYRT